jgi:hypothetical protein
MKPTQTNNLPAERPVHDDAERDNPVLQGEGNYTAARRHRESQKRFIDADKVQSAAAAAAPKSEEEAREMKAAENAGLARGRH